MRKFIISEQEKNSIRKMYLKETSITELPSGDFLMGGNFFGDGPKREIMSNMDHAIQGLQVVLMLMKFLPEKITMEQKKQLESEYYQRIEHSLYLAKSENDIETLEELEPMVEKVKQKVDEVLNSKLDDGPDKLDYNQ